MYSAAGKTNGGGKGHFGVTRIIHYSISSRIIRAKSIKDKNPLT